MSKETMYSFQDFTVEDNLPYWIPYLKGIFSGDLLPTPACVFHFPLFFYILSFFSPTKRCTAPLNLLHATLLKSSALLS